MNKFYSVFLAFFLAVGVLAGCGATEEKSQANTSQEEAVQEISVSLQLSKNNGEEVIADKELTVEKGLTLMEVLKNNFEVEEKDGFINGIEGISSNEAEKMAWMFTINGEQAMVGANEYVLEDGDEIVFDYHSWE